MDCPVCGNELKEYQAGELRIDICKDGCSGIWFDKDELQKCDEDCEAFPDELLRVKKNADVVVDKSRRRECPRCITETMQRLTLDKDRNFDIDHCNRCGGNWLDIGELSTMRRKAKEQAEIEQHLRSFEAKLSAQMSDPVARKRNMAFLKVIFR